MRTPDSEDKISTNTKKKSFSHWRSEILKRKRTAPITFAFVVALSLALSACSLLMGEGKSNYMGLIAQGNAARKDQNYTQATECYTLALADAEKKYGKDSGQVAVCLGYIGEIYRAQGEWRLAYFAYKRLVPLKEKLEPEGRQTRETKDLKKEFEVIKQKIREYKIKTDDEFDKETQKKPDTKTGKTSKKSKRRH